MRLLTRMIDHARIEQEWRAHALRHRAPERILEHLVAEPSQDLNDNARLFLTGIPLEGE